MLDVVVMFADIAVELLVHTYDVVSRIGVVENILTVDARIRLIIVNIIENNTSLPRNTGLNHAIVSYIQIIM